VRCRATWILAVEAVIILTPWRGVAYWRTTKKSFRPLEYMFISRQTFAETGNRLRTLRILRPLRLGCVVSFQITVLKVLAGHPEGRASIADLTRYVSILISSGTDWTNRTKRLAARAPKLDIFADSLVLRDVNGWHITEGGRQFLASLEAPLPIAAEPVPAPDMMKQPGHRRYRNFVLLLTMKSNRRMAEKKDPRDDWPNPKQRHRKWPQLGGKLRPKSGRNNADIGIIPM